MRILSKIDHSRAKHQRFSIRHPLAHWLLGLILLMGLSAAPAQAAVGVRAPTRAAAKTAEPQVAKPSTAISGTGIVALACGAALLLAGEVCLVGWALRRSFAHNAALDPNDAWASLTYRKALPNALAALGARGLPSPWPTKPGMLALHRFERQLVKTLQPALGHRTRRFVRQHLTLWSWTWGHRNALAQMLRERQKQRAFARVPAAYTERERQELLAFLSSDDGPRAVELSHKHMRRLLKRCLELETIFREHGYHVSPELAAMEVIDAAPDDALVDLLPPPRARRVLPLGR